MTPELLFVAVDVAMTLGFVGYLGYQLKTGKRSEVTHLLLAVGVLGVVALAAVLRIQLGEVPRHVPHAHTHLSQRSSTRSGCSPAGSRAADTPLVENPSRRCPACLVHYPERA